MSTVFALIMWLVMIQLLRWISGEARKPSPPVYQYRTPTVVKSKSYISSTSTRPIPTSTLCKNAQSNGERCSTPPILEYFSSNFGSTLKPSPAEQLIINELVKYPVLWEREVSFPGLRFATGGWGRFDFLLIDYNVVIEYNSKKYHNLPQRAEVDKIKQEFCKDNNITYIAYSSSDYYHIPERISTLMASLKVSPTYRLR